MREWSETCQNTYSMYFLLGKPCLLTVKEGFILVCFNLFNFITLQLLILYTCSVQCANLF